MLVSDACYHDYAYLKKLGNSYKLIKCNSVKRKGLEVVNISTECDSIATRNGYKLKVYNFKKDVANCFGRTSEGPALT